MIRLLKSKDRIRFIDYCKNYKDEFEDNYITVERGRKFFSEKTIANKIFNNIMKRGDKCFIYEENENIKGIMLIIGFSDKFPRKYVKCIADNYNYSFRLFDFLLMNYDNLNLFIKIKRFNPLCKLMKIFKFNKIGLRGRETLFVKAENKYDRSY